MHDTTEEAPALERLARAHKEARARRLAPPPTPASDEETKARIAAIWRNVQAPEPQDVAVMRAAQDDPLGTAIWSQLSVVGWRLYAKGGVDLLVSVYRKIEVEQHPAFTYAVRQAWRGLGFPGDPGACGKEPNCFSDGDRSPRSDPAADGRCPTSFGDVGTPRNCTTRDNRAYRAWVRRARIGTTALVAG